MEPVSIIHVCGSIHNMLLIHKRHHAFNLWSALSPFECRAVVKYLHITTCLCKCCLFIPLKVLKVI